MANDWACAEHACALRIPKECIRYIMNVFSETKCDKSIEGVFFCLHSIRVSTRILQRSILGESLHLDVRNYLWQVGDNTCATVDPCKLYST